MKTENKEIAERITRLREELNFSQSSLANLCSVELKTLKYWEDGIFLPEGKNLYTLAKNLNTSSEFVIYGNDDIPASKIMGTNLVLTYVVLAIICAVIIIFSSLNSLPAKGNESAIFSSLAIGAVVYLLFYWMAALLNSIIATRSTNERILQELIKLNKSKND